VKIAAISVWIVPLLLAAVLVAALRRRVNVYSEFAAGAADGLKLGLRLIPLIIGIYVAIGLFRESGALLWLSRLAAPALAVAGFPPDVLPLMLIRPFSHAAAMGVVADLLAQHGPDSFVGLLASIMQGSSETTFYVLTLYLGSVGIRNSRYAVQLCLLGDLLGYFAALWITVLLFIV